MKSTGRGMTMAAARWSLLDDLTDLEAAASKVEAALARL
jgi:hypothetical protein